MLLSGVAEAGVFDDDASAAGASGAGAPEAGPLESATGSQTNFDRLAICHPPSMCAPSDPSAAKSRREN